MLSRSGESLLFLPLLLGWSSAKEVVLEGMAAAKRGAHDIVTGIVVGVVGGLGLSVLLVLIDNFDLRDPLVNWSPQLFDLLGFSEGMGFGLWMWPVLCGALAGLGAAMQIMAPKIRRAIVTALIVVLGLAIFETFIIDVFEFVEDRIYAQRGGLKLSWAIGLGLFAAAASFVSGDSMKAARANIAAATGQERTRNNTVMILGSAPEYPHGCIDPIEAMGEIAQAKKAATRAGSVSPGATRVRVFPAPPARRSTRPGVKRAPVGGSFTRGSGPKCSRSTVAS